MIGQIQQVKTIPLPFDVPLPEFNLGEWVEVDGVLTQIVGLEYVSRLTNSRDDDDCLGWWFLCVYIRFARCGRRIVDVIGHHESRVIRADSPNAKAYFHLTHEVSHPAPLKTA